MSCYRPPLPSHHLAYGQPVPRSSGVKWERGTGVRANTSDGNAPKHLNLIDSKALFAVQHRRTAGAVSATLPLRVAILR